MVEPWTCAGRRWAAGLKRLSTAWVDAQGLQRLYAKVTGVVGGEYEVSVQHAGDTVTVYGQPAFIGRADRESAELGAWEVADRAAYAAQQRRRLEASARRRSELDDAAGPVLAIAARLTSYADRAALAGYLTAKIHKAAGDQR